MCQIRSENANRETVTLSTQASRKMKYEKKYFYLTVFWFLRKKAENLSNQSTPQPRKQRRILAILLLWNGWRSGYIFHLKTQWNFFT